MEDIVKRSLFQHSRALREREYSSLELTEAFIKNIEKRDGEIGAYLCFDPEGALSLARRADELLSSGEAHPLCGIPMALKDNISVSGLPMTCASRILSGYIPPYSATVWERLYSAGGVLLGKTNMDEFAMGSSNENSAYKITRNPLDTARSPGGSSGGSAAAVAADLAAYSLGSDTGGSVRTPAAYCSLVGMKPTYGRVSRYGLTAFASSLDQIGPITRNIRDNALVLGAVSGADKKDSTSKDAGGLEIPKISPKSLRVGICPSLIAENTENEVLSAYNEGIKAFERAGAEIVTLSLDSLQYALSAYYIISSAEASSNLARYDGVRYSNRAEGVESLDELYKKTRSLGFGDEVKRRIILGTFVLSEGYRDEYYKKARAAAALIKQDILKAFESCDIILAPITPELAPLLKSGEASPVSEYQRDIYSVIANLAGIPSLTVPYGEKKGGLRPGLQLMGAPFSEGLLYSAALLIKGEEENEYL